MGKRLKTCAEPDCPKLVMAARCPTHTREVDRSYKDPAKRRVYAGRRWQGMRRTVLKEQPWCQNCGINMTTDIHHVVALEDGGKPFDRANVTGLCKACHSRITAQEIWGRKAQ